MQRPRRRLGATLANRQAAAMEVEPDDALDERVRGDEHLARRGKHVGQVRERGFRAEHRAHREAAGRQQAPHHQPGFRDQHAPVRPAPRPRQVAVVGEAGIVESGDARYSLSQTLFTWV